MLDRAFQTLAARLVTSLESMRLESDDPFAIGLRASALSTLHLKALPELEAEGDLPLFVAIQGGTNVGRSTVFNALSGRTLSPSRPGAATTRHPLVSAHRRWRERLCAPGFFPGIRRIEIDAESGALIEIDTSKSRGGETSATWARENADRENADRENADRENADLAFGIASAAEQALLDPTASDLVFLRFHSDEELAPFALIDSPDLDSTITSNREIARKVSAIADVIVFVTTAEKHRDRLLVEDLRGLAADKPAVEIVFNRLDDEGVFRQLLGDLNREISPDREVLHGVRAPTARSSAPEHELGGALRHEILARLRALSVREAKSSVLARTLDRVATETRDLAHHLCGEIEVKAELRRRIESACETASRDYVKTFALSLPEETLAIRRAIEWTEISSLLSLPEEIRSSQRVLGWVSAGARGVGQQLRSALLRLSHSSEGSIEEQPGALSTYADARDETDFDNVVRSARRVRLEIEGFLQSRRHASALAAHLLSSRFSAEDHDTLPDRLRPTFESTTESRRGEAERIFADVEEWGRTHPRARGAIRFASIACKLALGVGCAWILPPGSGPLSLLNWVWLLAGYLVGAYAIALVVGLCLRRRARFRSARQATHDDVIASGVTSPLLAEIDRSLDESAVRDLERQAATLLTHPQIYREPRLARARNPAASGGA